MIIKDQNPAKLLFNQFCDGYKKREMPYLLSLFTANANMWGSGIDEYRVGLKQIAEQLERDWSQSEQGEIKIETFVPTSNNTLWAAALCTAKITIDGTPHIFEQLRGTIVIAQEEGIWKIAHMHASFPDYRNAENGSFPINN